MTTCAQGKVFYQPEDQSEVLFLLKQGRVQLYRLSPSGRKIVTGTVEAGSFFGEMAIIGQGMHHTFAEALDDCLLCVMSRADVERVLLRDPRVAMRLVEALGKRLTDAEIQLEEMVSKHVPARLAGLLLRWAAGAGGVEGHTHQDFADAIGSNRETVTQTLNDFKSQGLVEIGWKSLQLLDRERLQVIANQPHPGAAVPLKGSYWGVA
ncbi:MAG: Crp/Fnr family transcriptional regulator [Chloroflexi bacterium]|nr:Crp/Fnr family transcriptional regulator [Chloroflexota bacterium]